MFPGSFISTKLRDPGTTALDRSSSLTSGRWGLDTKGGDYVSKKKWRYKKRKHKKKVNTSALNTHHLCFIRRNWGRKYAKAIRQFYYCQIELPKDTVHRIIHEKLYEVPAPREVVAKYAYEQLLLLQKYGALHENDPIEKRLMILAALFDCVEQPTADAFRKQLEIVQNYKSKPP